jgi:hypothetical protein
LVWTFFQIHRHYKETAARLKLDHTPEFEIKPVMFDPAKDKEIAIYFCDTWSKLAVRVVTAILKRGLPMLIIHINVDPKRGDAFLKRSREIMAVNGWDESQFRVVDDPYRDLHKSVARTLNELRAQYPDIYFEIYVGALRTKFPYNLLHMSTDRFLRDALYDADDVALNIKQIDLDAIPLPPGFKVTFEHATESHHEEQAAHA